MMTVTTWLGWRDKRKLRRKPEQQPANEAEAESREGRES